MMRDLDGVAETMAALNKRVKKIISSFTELEGALDATSEEAERLLAEHASHQV